MFEFCNGPCSRITLACLIHVHGCGPGKGILIHYLTIHSTGIPPSVGVLDGAPHRATAALNGIPIEQYVACRTLLATLWGIGSNAETPHETEASEQSTVIQEQLAKLESGISNSQAAIAMARERQQQLQGQRSHLKQRASSAIAAVDTILSVSHLLPDAPAAPDPLQQGTCSPLGLA